MLRAGSGGGWNGIGGLSVWQQRGDGAPDGARTGRWPATGLGRPSLVAEATAAAAASDVVRTMVEAGLEAHATLFSYEDTHTMANFYATGEGTPVSWCHRWSPCCSCGLARRPAPGWDQGGPSSRCSSTEGGEEARRDQATAT